MHLPRKMKTYIKWWWQIIRSKCVESKKMVAEPFTRLITRNFEKMPTKGWLVTSDVGQLMKYSTISISRQEESTFFYEILCNTSIIAFDLLSFSINLSRGATINQKIIHRNGFRGLQWDCNISAVPKKRVEQFGCAWDSCGAPKKMTLVSHQYPRRPSALATYFSYPCTRFTKKYCIWFFFCNKSANY